MSFWIILMFLQVSRIGEDFVSRVMVKLVEAVCEEVTVVNTRPAS